MLFERIQVEFDFLSASLPAVIKSLCGESGLKSLDFIAECNRLSQQGADFPSAWKQSITESLLPLRNTERERLCEVSSLLGSSDLTGQKRILSMYIRLFTELSQQAKDEEKKYASLSVTGGIFIGCILFVLVI